MTDPGKPLELQSLTSPDGRMSGTGSFGHGDSFATETTLVPAADTEVGAMGPLYQTVPDANKSHAQYRAEKVRSASSPAGPAGKHYMTPGEPSEPNEYDIINDRQVRGKHSSTSTPPQVRLHSENVLYGDQASAAEELRHATLTMDKQQQKYSGGVSSGITYEQDVPSSTICGCKPIIVWMCFFVFIALVLAIVALVMVVVIAFGVYEVPCNCDDESSQPVLSVDVVALQAQVEELTRTIQKLNSSATSDVDELTRTIQELNSSATGQVDDLQQELTSLSGRVTTTEQEQTDLQNILSGGDVSFAATLTGVNPYVNCTTEAAGFVEVPISASIADSGPSYGVGLTPTVDMDVPGFYTVDAYCARTDNNNNELNPIVGTLHILPNGQVRCACYIVVPDNSGLPQVATIKCTLFFTRCPILQDFDTTIQTQT